MEELAHQDTTMDSKDQTHVAKGKRTKRQRLQSPIPFAIPSNSSAGDGEFPGHCNFRPETTFFPATSSNFSPTTSSELQYTTEEEEDMANCLILLAQGTSLKHPVAGAGYECKTCYRTFPSFQALGGHRASHKKPNSKATAMDDQKKVLLSSDDEETQLKNSITHPISLQLNQRGNNLYGGGKTKVHECAICGAEFSSGQALGGHMRRHRAVPPVANTALSLSPALSPAAAMEREDQRPAKRQRSVISLDLDLNLPAPQEHDQREAKTFQQQPLVFSARTLVDCHY